MFALAGKLIRLLFYIEIKLLKNFNPYLGRWRRELLKGINRAEPQSLSTYSLLFLQSLYKRAVTVFCTFSLKDRYDRPRVHWCRKKAENRPQKIQIAPNGKTAGNLTSQGVDTPLTFFITFLIKSFLNKIVNK